ncbi:hypothetical protein ACFPVT_07355 [Corynebacterium choanae]|uniref:DUF4149 domain-containing protein n=1 Tax=Corynebacterium choanae TaxID=1862358 RepID=A0A3G6J731_9CORY|nr:hypothetical protein [Corynebacterium choanae]AZA13915.1 hypothetical protein CCHOA_07615 [Corynebacterium choanae]
MFASTAARNRAALCLIIPVFWLGLIVAISGIEAPLKFLAPGITIPLGLGIGRLVFAALNTVEIILAVTLWLVQRKAAVTKHYVNGLIVATITLLFQVAVLRPLLNGRTNAVIAGDYQGGSLWHWLYIGAEMILGVALIFLIVQAIRQWMPVQRTTTLR